MRKNKIRILHVAQAAGGVDRYIRMLLKYLDKEKFENILVCSQDFHEEDYKGLLDSFEQIEMTRAIGRTDLKAIKEVRALIKKYNPDIVYAENIPYVDLHEQRGKLPGKLDRLNNWYQFASAVKKKMKTVKDASQTLFWFGTAETAMPMVGKLKGYNYALTSLELLDDNKTKNRLFSMLTGDAKFIVCCETTRAFIMRNWDGLKKLPYVMPNKPYDFQDARRKTPSIEATKKAIELVQDKKFIIYQGILKSRDYMLEMARAIRDSGTGYYFVLMGLDPENIFADQADRLLR